MSLLLRTDVQSRLRQHSLYRRERDAAYLGSYQIILGHFRSIKFENREQCRLQADAAVLLVYTWMGGAKPKLDCLNSYFNCCKDIRSARTNQTITQKQLERICSYVSGSLIATSKFLHFLNPEQYPIWDRRVADALYGLRHYNQHQKLENYMQYLKDVPRLEIPDTLSAEIVSLLGNVSAMRRAEFAVFNLDVAEKDKVDRG